MQRVREYVGQGDRPADTTVFLVDRLWPRGIAKAELRATWARDVAPSTELRRWFGHDPGRWHEFAQRYRAELAGNPAVQPLLDAARSGPVLLLFDARDTERNQAVVLAGWLRENA